MQPRPIDAVFAKEGRTLLGIYRLEGNFLTLCLAGPGTRRPTAFASAPGSRLSLFVLKRRTPGRKGAAAPAAPAAPVAPVAPVAPRKPTDIGRTFRGAGQEYRLPIRTGDQLFIGSFVDSGTVLPSGVNSSSGVAGSLSLGMSYTVPALGPVPLALDFGFPVTEDSKHKQAFAFWLGFFR
jgi:hypothetical protein